MDEPYTTVPNWIMDLMQPCVKPSVLSIVIAVCRQTIGYQKKSDVISLSRFMALTGLSRPTVIRSINEAVEAGYILKIGNKFLLASGKEILPDLKKTLPKSVKKCYPQKKKENTKKKEEVTPPPTAPQKLMIEYGTATLDFPQDSHKNSAAAIKLIQHLNGDYEKATQLLIEKCISVRSRGYGPPFAILIDWLIKDLGPRITPDDEKLWNHFITKVIDTKANELSPALIDIIHLPNIGPTPADIRYMPEVKLPELKQAFFIEVNKARARGIRV